MIKVLKWVYKLGYNKAMENVFNTLDKEYMFHSTQSQIKSLKDIKPSDDWLNVRRLSPKDHEQRYLQIADIQTKLDPKRYPDMTSYFDMTN